MPNFSGKTNHKIINTMTQSIGIPHFMILVIYKKKKLQESLTLMNGNAFITQ